MRLRPPRPALFPYTTLFRSPALGAVRRPITRQPQAGHPQCTAAGWPWQGQPGGEPRTEARGGSAAGSGVRPRQDRKSTRLKSSHVRISYAVFCLKKKRTIHAKSCRNHRTEITTELAYSPGGVACALRQRRRRLVACSVAEEYAVGVVVGVGVRLR